AVGYIYCLHRICMALSLCADSLRSRSRQLFACGVGPSSSSLCDALRCFGAAWLVFVALHDYEFRWRNREASLRPHACPGCGTAVGAFLICLCGDEKIRVCAEIGR